VNQVETAVAVGWNYRLVVLSYVIAVFASYTALDLAGRVAAGGGRGRIAWLAGGAFAMGVGIWSMHFTGMLALKMDMPVTYDVLDTLLSMAVAIAAATLAFFVVSRGVVGVGELALAAPVMGIGIASMHYTRMAAMRMQAAVSYDPLLVAASVLIAIGASMAALWLFLRLNRGDLTSGTKTLLKGGSALVHMPEMDGYEATREIGRREEEGGGHTPIMALTADAMQGDREKALDAGMDDYVPKPVKREELETILERWVSREDVTLPASAEGSGSFPQKELEDGLDQAVIANLRELGDSSLLSELAQMFLEEVPERLGALREAIEKGDAQAVKRITHTLKGSSATMGARRMYRLCLGLEQAGESNDLSAAASILELLNQEFDRVRTQLSVLVD
jgi:NO-binding membrane sensor protein with MHYT domain/HPt (histidine-containing phosphotransfer) domain-containing protein